MRGPVIRRPHSFDAAAPEKTEWRGRAHAAATTGTMWQLWLDDSEPCGWNRPLYGFARCNAEDLPLPQQDWECAACAYPRTGDLRSVIKLSTSPGSCTAPACPQGMRKSGREPRLLLCLPNDRGRVWFWQARTSPSMTPAAHAASHLSRPTCASAPTPHAAAHPAPLQSSTCSPLGAPTPSRPPDWAARGTVPLTWRRPGQYHRAARLVASAFPE